MYQWAFLDELFADDSGNPLVTELTDRELLFETGWSDLPWDAAAEEGASDIPEAPDDNHGPALTFAGRESRHELLTRRQEGDIAMALQAAFGRLQAELGHRRETLDALMEHIITGQSELPPEQFDTIVTLYDTLMVYEQLARRSSRFEAEYRQVWQRLCEGLQQTALDRDYVLGLAGADHHRKGEVECLTQAVFSVRNRFVSANVRLVYHVARRHMDKGMALEDMVQEGVLGLMRAAMKFDPGVGVRFSTYAFWWIKQAIRQAIARQRSLIRYPTQVNDQVNRIYGVVQDEIRRTGKKPDLKRIRKLTGFSRRQIRDLMGLTNLCVSASAPLYDDGDKTLLDDISYSQQYGLPDADSASVEAVEQLQQLLSLLSEREAMVLKMKYGIGQRRPYSLNEIAPQLGVSRERVRQIIEEATAKLQQHCAAAPTRDNPLSE